jgi:hypothetical protein
MVRKPPFLGGCLEPWANTRTLAKAGRPKIVASATSPFATAVVGRLATSFAQGEGRRASVGFRRQVSFSAISQIAMRLNRNIETLAQNAKISARGTSGMPVAWHIGMSFCQVRPLAARD